jgi:hypothetical protein
LNSPIKIDTLAASDAAVYPAVYRRNTLDTNSMNCMHEINAYNRNSNPTSIQGIPHQNKQASKFTKADVPEEWKPHSIAHLAGPLSGKQNLD